MPEPRPDMFPDPEGTNGTVETQEDEGKTETTTTPSDTTPPKGYVPYQALDEERRKRKELEVKLAEVEVLAPKITDEELSDEGRLLAKQNEELAKRLRLLEEETTFSRLTSQFPQLNENRAEFEEYRTEYEGVPLEKIAKIFLAEKDLLSERPVRKGLETVTSGSQHAPKSGIQEDEVKRLREDNPRKYIQLLQNGKLNPDDIR